MNTRTSSPVSVFDKVLRAFGTGDLLYTEVLAHLRGLLATDASPTELLAILQRRELLDPIPEHAHAELLGLINEAIERNAAEEAAAAAAENAESAAARDASQDASTAPATSASTEDPTVSLRERDSRLASARSSVAEFVRTPGASQPPRAETVRLLEERIARHRANYEALTRSYELAQQAEGTAAARATALATELAGVRNALDSEQTKSRKIAGELADAAALVNAAHRESERRQSELRSLQDALSARDAQLAALSADLAAARSALESEQARRQTFDKAQADKTASIEAARLRSEAVQRDSQRYQAEVRTLRDAIEARDAAIDQVRHSLGERDAQLAALQQDYVKVVPELDTRVKASVKLEAELQTARARNDALALELKAAKETAAALSAELGSGEARLNAARGELGIVKKQANSYLETLRTREWRRGYDHDVVRELQAEHAALQAQHAALQTAHAELQAEHTALHAKHTALQAQQDASRATLPEHDILVDLQSVELPTAARQRAADEAPRDAQPRAVPRRRRPPLKPGTARAIAAGAAAAVLVFAAWTLLHRPREAPKAAVPAVAAPVPGTVIQDCPTCPVMTVLAPGRFKQGSAGAENGPGSFERPLHWVAIGHPFAMSTNAITVGQFQEFIAATGRDMQGCDTYDREWRHQVKNSWKDPGFVQSVTHPVTCASWNDAKAYAAWLSAKTGYHYRLPSASEWEYAAFAAGDAAQPWSPDGSNACASANVADASALRRYPGWTAFSCDDGFVYTAPVGSFKANAFGLNDMLGNVFQWTEDCWHADYVGAPVDGEARMDGDCSEHELRGGSWFTSPGYVRANYRNHFAADYRTSTVGIRLARDLTQ